MGRLVTPTGLCCLLSFCRVGLFRFDLVWWWTGYLEVEREIGGGGKRKQQERGCGKPSKGNCNDKVQSRGAAAAAAARYGGPDQSWCNIRKEALSELVSTAASNMPKEWMDIATRSGGPASLCLWLLLIAGGVGRGGGIIFAGVLLEGAGQRPAHLTALFCLG